MIGTAIKDQNQESVRIRRRDKLPSVFCVFPWVRVLDGAFADCQTPEDQRMVSLFQEILKRQRDVSELDDEYGLTLAVEVPKNILAANGRSGTGFGPVSYYWKFYDVHYLLTGNKPGEAVPISDAGFSQDDLAALAKPDAYLFYVRNFEKYSGKPKGHYFPVELEQQLSELERKQNARVKLRDKLLTLRVPRNESGDVQTYSVPEKLKNEVREFHHYKCIFDGNTRPEFSIHVHHVIPRRLIERLSLPERLFTARENLVACCSGCNIVKSDWLSKADVRFYLRQFSQAEHPNNRLVPFLKRIAELQADGDEIS